MYKSIYILNNIFEKNILNNDVVYENQNREYEGFAIPKLNIRSRLAKKTPKKKGYFVACYMVTNGEPNRPYGEKESLDYLAVCVNDEDRTGAFIFPKHELIRQQIITKNVIGKMAFRVYPPFITNLNATAKKTQQWQAKFYHEIE